MLFTLMYNVLQANMFTIFLSSSSSSTKLYLAASNGHDIALDTAEDKWELLPNIGNLIRHISTGKFLGTSTIPLDSTVKLTDQVSIALHRQ